MLSSCSEAEWWAAVFAAWRGHVELGVSVALRSASQVAALLIPAVAMLSWLIKPLPLAFRPAELLVLGGSAVVAGAVLLEGRSSRARGAILVGAYAVCVVVFYVAA